METSEGGQEEERNGDVNREKMTWQKFMWPIRLFSSKNNCAIVKVDRFKDIDIGFISGHCNKIINGVILDIDETVAPHHGEILDENIDKIREMIAEGIKIIVFSNMKWSQRYDALDDLGVDIHCSQYPKPDPRGFLECCEKMGLEPEEVVMIGDNPVTDGGCVQAGIDFVSVTPIEAEEEGEPSFARSVQLKTRDYFRSMSDGDDLEGSRNVLDLRSIRT